MLRFIIEVGMEKRVVVVFVLVKNLLCYGYLGV